MSRGIGFVHMMDLRSRSAPEAAVEADASEEGAGGWEWMLPEILVEIVRRVDEGGAQWPARKSVIAFAGVCRRWREVTMSVIRSPIVSGRITFPYTLKQPGPKDSAMQCFIKRDKRSSMYYLFLGLTNACADNGKLLLAARRSRRGAHIEYVISLDANDLSQGSNAYMGKLRSDFLGINFTLYDSQPPFAGAKAVLNRSSRRFASKQISPQVPAGIFEIGNVSYKFNFLRSRGPRRMECTLQCLAAKQTAAEEGSKMVKSQGAASTTGEQFMLKNKAPRWHEHLQCWCLNFHGRVTVASVKNFQLAVAADPSRHKGSVEDELVVLQFGKVDDDVFTMDYRDPLSAFHAFAICLTSFGTKIACE